MAGENEVVKTFQEDPTRIGDSTSEAQWESGDKAFGPEKVAEELSPRISIPDSDPEEAYRRETAKEVAEPIQNKARKRVDQILGLFLEGTDVFHTLEQEAYATVSAGGRHQTLPIAGKDFRRWIQHLYYKEYETIPADKDLTEALRQLTAKAVFDGPTMDVHLRYASYGEQVFIDLANDSWEQIRVTKAGWEIVSAKDSPVKFKRPAGMLALCYPSDVPASMKEISRFFNVRNPQDLLLMVSWLLGAINPAGPFPILVLQGEQGTAKSTTARLLKDLIDPSTVPLRTMPANERDLAIASSKMWVLSLDNLSGLSIWLSDALCRLATGGGFGTRALYTNDSEILFNASRPVILNGISDIATRHDLADRALIVQLPFISEEARMSEKQLAADWAKAKPAILRTLLDAMAVALGRNGEVSIPKLPRMADFARWVTAAEPGLKWRKGTFLRAFAANRMSLIDSALESDLVGSAILALMTKSSSWSGTPSQLYETLKGMVPDFERRTNAWPKGVNVLSHRVLRAQAFLRKKFIQVERKSGERTIIIRCTKPQTVQLAQPEANTNTIEPPSEFKIQYHPPKDLPQASRMWRKREAGGEPNAQNVSNTREEGEI